MVVMEQRSWQSSKRKGTGQMRPLVEEANTTAKDPEGFQIPMETFSISKQAESNKSCMW